ncbi:MAG: DNA polymerase III subunit gamma/tau, partial [Deltaproteobacteria bacterium]|nr:DNA polymerase III subunit gamma/tau [Deltaproteobacteria bacterium]
MTRLNLLTRGFVASSLMVGSASAVVTTGGACAPAAPGPVEPQPPPSQTDPAQDAPSQADEPAQDPALAMLDTGAPQQAEPAEEDPT